MKYLLKEYPVFSVERGILTKKKIKYINLEKEPLDLRFESERPDICTIKDK